MIIILAIISNSSAMCINAVAVLAMGRVELLSQDFIEEKK